MEKVSSAGSGTGRQARQPLLAWHGLSLGFAQCADFLTAESVRLFMRPLASLTTGAERQPMFTRPSTACKGVLWVMVQTKNFF